MARADSAKLEATLKQRAEHRKKTPASDRETAALEGIYDELTSLNSLVAAMFAKMK